MKKEDVLTRLKKTYCRIQPSSHHGVGVFAAKSIPAHIDPFQGVRRQRWFKFEVSKLIQTLDKEILKMIEDFYVIEDKYVWIAEHGLNGMDISFFVNNSDQPNLKAVINEETDFISEFITLREINKDEELTVAYSTYDDHYQ